MTAAAASIAPYCGHCGGAAVPVQGTSTLACTICNREVVDRDAGDPPPPLALIALGSLLQAVDQVCTSIELADQAGKLIDGPARLAVVDAYRAARVMASRITAQDPSAIATQRDFHAALSTVIGRMAPMDVSQGGWRTPRQSEFPQGWNACMESIANAVGLTWPQRRSRHAAGADSNRRTSPRSAVVRAPAASSPEGSS